MTKSVTIYEFIRYKLTDTVPCHNVIRTAYHPGPRTTVSVANSQQWAPEDIVTIRVLCTWICLITPVSFFFMQFFHQPPHFNSILTILHNKKYLCWRKIQAFDYAIRFPAHLHNPYTLLYKKNKKFYIWLLEWNLSIFITLTHLNTPIANILYIKQ